MSVEYETCKTCKHSTYKYRCDGCGIPIDFNQTWIELHPSRNLDGVHACSVPCLQKHLKGMIEAMRKDDIDVEDEIRFLENGADETQKAK